MTAQIVSFPETRQQRRTALDAPCQIMILPVIRIERFDDADLLDGVELFIDGKESIIRFEEPWPWPQEWCE